MEFGLGLRLGSLVKPEALISIPDGPLLLSPTRVFGLELECFLVGAVSLVEGLEASSLLFCAPLPDGEVNGATECN